MKRQFSVTYKLLLFVAISVLIVVGLPTAANLNNIQRDTESKERQNLLALYADFDNETQRAGQALSALALSLADRPDIQELLESQDREALSAQLEPIFNTLRTDYDVTQLYVEKPTGIVFLCAHDATKNGRNITNRSSVVTVRDSQRVIGGIDMDSNSLAVRSIAPIFHQNDFIGMLEVGREYGQDFVENLKTQTEAEQIGADYKIWLSRRDASRVGLDPATDAPMSPFPDLFYYAGTDPRSLPFMADVYRTVLESGKSEIQYVSDDQQEMAVLIAPLRSYQDQIIGILEIVTPRLQAPSGLLQNQTTTLIVAGLLTLFALGLMGVAINWVVWRPLGQLATIAQRQLSGDLSARAELSTGDEFEQLSHTLDTLTEKLDETLQGLEDTIARRTATMERRSNYLEASAEVSRVASSILDPVQLVQRSVDLIRDRYSMYYVGLFLVDESGEWAVLRAGTGTAGRAMLARAHRIRVGEGMIGWSIMRARARVASEAEADDVRQATAELPETRSEIAIPLRSRGQVLGALSVQSKEPNAFGPGAIASLQTMADHTAIALDNARLFAESQARLETTRQAYGQRSRDAWAGLLGARTDWGYSYDQRSVVPTQGDWPFILRQAEQTGQTVQKDPATMAQDGSGAPTLAIPIKVRENVIGVLGFDKDEARGPSHKDTGTVWTDEEVTLLETLIFQLGLALDGAQLYRDTERSAVREQLIGEVTAQIRETLDVETVLKTAAQQVRQALSLPEVVVRLSAHPAAFPTGGPQPYGGEESSP